MKNHLFLYALLIITVLLMVGCTPGIPQLPIDNLQGNEADQENQDEATGVPRVVFIELFNTEGCASSKVINPIMEEIAAEYENTAVILVEEAGWGIYSTEETSERFKWYLSDKSELHTPSVCFDGLNQLFAEGFSLGASGNSVNVVTGNIEDTEDNEDPEPGEVDTIKPDLVIEDTEEPVIEEPVETTGTIPQNWATGDGTAENPWANNCIKKAYDATPADGTIYLKAGYYQLAGNLDLAKQINIIGEGMNKTIIRTANTYGFTIIVAHVTLKGFTIDGDAQTAGDLPIINISNCDYIIVEDVEAKNGISTGVQPFQVNYSSFKNIYAHDNGEHGMHPCSNTTGTNIYNTYRDIYAWNNGDSGFDDRGIGKTTEQTNNIYDNLQCWDNVNHGIALTYQSGIVLSNSVVSGNGVCGIYLKYIEDSTVDNCSVILNDAEGILISAGVKNVNFTNVIVKNNKTGINIYNSSELVFTSCQSYDDRATPLQDYGIELREDANAGLTFLNCKLTPNRKGDIYNPAGVVLTIITEKRE